VVSFFSRIWVQVLVVFVVLIVFGALRMRFEEGLTRDLRDKKLLAPKLGMTERGMLDQKGFAAAFGSVRPVWAAMKSLGATGYHSEADWISLEEAYNEIVVLDPRNVNYWDVGSWHLAYNASSSSLDNESLPPLKREVLFRRYIEKGSAFLDRGIEANPEEWRLPVLKARLWSSEFRIENYPLVVDTLVKALLTIPERRQEAYEMGYELWKEGRRQHFPSLMNGFFVLQLDPDLDLKERVSLKQIYGDEVSAYKSLRNYWKRQAEGTPMKGLENVMRDMEERLGVRADSRLFSAVR